MLGRVFKAYDIRGTYPDLLTDQMAWQIGYGVAQFLLQDARAAGETTPMMRNIVVGQDMRKSSPKLTERLIDGITTFGAGVIDVGLVDTPMIYFAVNYLDCAGGVMVTASHNPPQYNGFKVSRRKGKPVGEETGLAEVRKHAAMVDKGAPKTQGAPIDKRDLWDAYAKHVRSFLDLKGRKLKIVVDASNGMAGTMIPKIFGKTGNLVEGLEIVPMNFDNSQGEFVHEPNPRWRRTWTSSAWRWWTRRRTGAVPDGDADRCAAVDERGNIIPCDFMTALLAPHFLRESPGGAIVYDLRSTKAVEEEIVAHGGRPIRSRVGHVHMKAALAEEDGPFGGELSGHFYFRYNFYADSGAIAMATYLSVLAESDQPMSRLIRPIARYQQSGEINFEIEEKDAALEAVEEAMFDRGDLDHLDGVTVDCFESEGWWCNIRKSNTEPLLRLNAEAKDKETLDKVVEELSPMLGRRVAH
ncbi:MAG: phosphomannomutase/phosphoglucomutase [Phycisphaerales bacterium]